MLNRTNRTLSANTNRLNLGTRKLDQNASANIGNLTLRTAHVDHLVDPVRAGMIVVDHDFMAKPFPMGKAKPMKPAISSISSSSFGSRRSYPGQPSHDQQGQPVALASQPVGTVVVRSGDHGTVRRVLQPIASSPELRPRILLEWRPETSRREGRSALANLVLVRALFCALSGG